MILNHKKAKTLWKRLLLLSNSVGNQVLVEILLGVECELYDAVYIMYYYRFSQVFSFSITSQCVSSLFRKSIKPWIDFTERIPHN